jgi:hypothetical protein
MKTTVDIPENELMDAMKYAKANTKREAIVTALVDYNRRKRMAELVEYSAVSETFMSNEELEALDARESAAKYRIHPRKSRKP